MLECVRYLEALLPVPKKDALDQYRKEFSAGHAIENIMNRQIETLDNIPDEDEDADFNFQCDEGLESADVDVMARIE